MNAIVTRLFKAAPLLDGHEAAQGRVSNPALNFVRSLCLAVTEEDRLDAEFSATNFVDLAGTHGIVIAGQKPGNEQNACRQVGILLARAFASADRIQVDGFSIVRWTQPEARPDSTGYYDAKRYRISKTTEKSTVPQQAQQDIQLARKRCIFL